MAGTTRAAISLCGLDVRADSIRLLVSKLDGHPLATKLERALANDNSIVALSFEERRLIVEVLAIEPAALGGLRTELGAQLRRHNDQTLKRERADRYREIADRRAAQPERPAPRGL